LLVGQEVEDKHFMKRKLWHSFLTLQAGTSTAGISIQQGVPKGGADQAAFSSAISGVFVFKCDDQIRIRNED